MADGLLIKQEKYLEAGIHIGTKLRVIDMTKFIYRTRNDGLFVLDLRKIDERIRLAGKLLAKYDPKDIVVVASRAYSSMAAQKFGQITGCSVRAGRFVPGAFTNVQRDDFIEPKLVIVCDPKGERQAVLECGKMGIATVGLCDTDNYTMFIDWAIPCNNKGRRSLGLIFWLLAREMAMGSGKVATYDDFKPTLEEFEAMMTAPVEAAPTPESAEAAAAGANAPITPSNADDKKAAEVMAEVEKGDEAEKPAAKAKKAKEEEESAEGEKKRKAKKAEDDEKAKKSAKKEEKAPEKSEEKKEHKHEEKHEGHEHKHEEKGHEHKGRKE